MPNRHTLLAGLVVAFLTVQVLAPAATLLSPRPARFGWHMYSALPPVPEVWAVRADGSEERIDLIDLLVAHRAEIDYALVAATELCGRLDAQLIRVQPRPGSVIETIEC